VDGPGTRLNGPQRFAAELTLRAGKVVFDLNGLTRPDWATKNEEGKTKKE